MPVSGQTKISSAAARRPFRRLARSFLIFFLWIAVWQGVYLLVGHEVLFASPARVAVRLTELVPQADFWRTVLSSLGRILAGLLLGVAAGVILAVITAASGWLSAFFAPLISLIKSTPVTSFIVLAMLWVTKSRVPVFISFLMVLPVIWSSVLEGIRQRDPALREMATLFRMKPWVRWRIVDIPMVLPYFTGAFSSALGLAWKAGITAEVLGNPEFSIGGRIYDAKIYLETPDLFAWTAVLILLSVALEKTLGWLLRRDGPAASAASSGAAGEAT